MWLRILNLFQRNNVLQLQMWVLSYSRIGSLDLCQHRHFSFSIIMLSTLAKLSDSLLFGYFLLKRKNLLFADSHHLHLLRIDFFTVNFLCLFGESYHLFFACGFGKRNLTLSVKATSCLIKVHQMLVILCGRMVQLFVNATYVLGETKVCSVFK